MPDPDPFAPVPADQFEVPTGPAPAQAAQPEAKPLSLGDRAKDLVDSVNSGIGTAFHETVNFGAKTVGTLVQGGERITKPLVESLTGVRYDPISDDTLLSVQEWSRGTAENDGSTYQPKTMVGGVSQGISQFLTGFALVGQGIKATQALQGVGTITKAAITGAAADAVAFDPNAARLSNLVNDFAEQHPTLRNPITEYLASKPEDQDSTGRLKNALEGMVAGAVLERTLRVLGATKRYLYNAPKDRAKAEKELAKALEEADKAAAPKDPKDADLEKLKRLTDGLAKTDVLGRRAFYDAKESERLFAERMGEEYKPTVDSDLALLEQVGGLPKPEPVLDPSLQKGGQSSGGTSGMPRKEIVDSSTTATGSKRQADAPLLPQVDKDAIQEAITKNKNILESGITEADKPLFNYSKWDGPMSAKGIVEETAKALSPDLTKSMTFKEIEAAAKDTGIDVTFAVNSGKVKATEIARTVVATKVLMQSQAREINLLAKKLAALPEGDEARGALKVQFDDYVQKLADTVTFGKTLQSEAARATAAGRIRTSDALSADELKVIAAAGGDVSTLTQVLKEKPLWVRAFDAHNQIWINSLLSGPRTHIRNILSNSINTIVLPVERAIGGAMSGNGAMFREGTDIALGLAGAFKDSIKMAAKAMGIPQTIAAKGNRWATVKSTGQSVLDPGNTKLASTNSAAPALSTDNFKSLEGTKLGEVMNGFGQIANIPSRFLTGEDEFFKQINYRAHVTAAASASARKLGLKGKDMADYIARRLEESMDDKGAAKLYSDDGIYTVKDPDYEAALEYARRATFTSKAEQGSFTAWLESGVHNHPYLKLITPFVRTPINILKNAGLRTPVLNLASKKYRDALTGKLGERAAADARGQMAVGAALWTSAITMAMEGSVTGKGPRDPKERAALIDTGWQPYSFKVGDKYLSFEGFDPFSMFFGLAGDYADMSAHLDDPTRDSVVAGMFIAAAQNITSKSYLLGLTQAMDALSDPGNKMEAFLRNRAASYVPSALMQGAGLVGQSDPYMREARTTMDAVLRRIPGFSEALPPKRNVFGEAVTARQALGPDSISPFFTSTLTDNKAKLELARLAHAFGPPARVINGVDLTTVRNAKGQDFYDAWQAKLQTYRFGRYTLKEKLENLVTSPQYAKWRENEADALSAGETPRTLSEVQAVISEYRERAKQEILRSGEFPELSDALRAQKKAQVRARAGAEIPDAVLNILNFNKQ